MKFKFFIIFFLFLSIILGAQTVHDPNSEIYKDIDIWLVKGYVKEFPPMIRPYPVKLIYKILEQVIDNGDEKAVELAQKYLDMLLPGKRFLHVGLKTYAQGNAEDYGFVISPFAEGLLHIRNLLSVSYNYTVHADTDKYNNKINRFDGEQFIIPGNYSPYPDLENDRADIGPFRVLQNWTSLLALGNSDIYFQGGLSRSSYGPFYDNGVVVGPQAPRAGHFSFVYWDTLFSFEILFQSIVATDYYFKEWFPAKYNVVHTLNFRPIQNIEFGLVQSLTYGERIELLYLLPFSYLFGSQSINGFNDNAFMGLNFRWRPINTFLVNTQIYIDDFSFNGILDGKPNFKAAGEIGVSWSPARSILSKLDFDYTAVMPYTYTHWVVPSRLRYNGYEDNDQTNSPLGKNGDPVANYYDYTHRGRNIGPDLEPNSDRFSLRSNWKIIRNLDINLSAYLIRHANASADKPLFDQDYHDGTIFDSGGTDPWHNKDEQPGKTSIQNYYDSDMEFLTQSVIETKLGGTIGVTWSIPTSFGTFKLMGGYGIQYGWNRSINSTKENIKSEIIEGNNGFDHFWNIGIMWSW
ncbi:hypothetical protein R84B8_02101 [Treponema sp. R8-4-B8]